MKFFTQTVPSFLDSEWWMTVVFVLGILLTATTGVLDAGVVEAGTTGYSFLVVLRIFAASVITAGSGGFVARQAYRSRR